MNTKTFDQCLKDPEYCEKALQKLVSLKFSEMEKLVDEQHQCITKYLVNPQAKVMNLDADALRQMDYLDVLRLIDSIRDNVLCYGNYYDEDDTSRGRYSAEDEYRYHIAMLFYFLMEAKTKDDSVKTICRMTVGSLASALESHAKTGKVMAAYEDFIRDYQEAGWIEEENRDSVTVEELLNFTNKYLSRKWLPTVRPIAEHESDIQGVLDYTGTLLVDFFKFAYPERFRSDDINDKCRRDEDAVERVMEMITKSIALGRDEDA
ncbi:MAG: hypothetical protein K6D90_05235 [Lachnospiraceae bacterium]|nr:hypothetical protein [Lachnospiraceae bacterium]